ncbi:energy transducer TonB [Niveibacterium sp. SC-1]|uniref:energy transducer TonB n=1 Tax=Niveibacterium sp. SC-1 TaxID=3135646 RepID=UPI00311E8FAB
MERNPAFDEREEPGRWSAAVFTFVAHLVLILVLVYGVRWQTHTPEVFEVALVRSDAAPAPTATAPPPKPVPPPPEPKPQPKPEPKVEPEAPKPVAKPDIALPEPKPKKPEPKPEPKPEKKPEPKPEKKPPEKAEPRNDLQAQLEAEQKRLDAATAKKAQQERMNDLLAKDMGAVANARAKVSAGNALDAWINAIRAKVRGNIVWPGEQAGNPEVVFRLKLLPSGEVMGQPELKKSSGNRTLDDAIERAIIKSSPLPLPTQRDVFVNDLELVLRPFEK